MIIRTIPNPLNRSIQPLICVDDEAETEAPRRGGCGCWVTAITTLVVFVVLVGDRAVPAADQPAASACSAPQFTTLTASANAVADNGLTLAAYNLQGGGHARA